MASKADQSAFDKQLSLLDNLAPNTQLDWDKFAYTNSDLANRIAGLFNPESNAQANQGFDQGLNTYDQRASQMFDNPGYTDQEKQGQRLATQIGFEAPFASAANDVKLNQQRTGNSAGVNGAIQGLARQRGQMISAGLGGLEKGFGDARMQGQKDALSLSQFPQQARLQRMQGERDTAGLEQNNANAYAQLYGTGISGQLGAAGMRNSSIASDPSFLKTLGQGIAGGLGKSIGAGAQQGLSAAFA